MDGTISFVAASMLDSYAIRAVNATFVSPA